MRKINRSFTVEYKNGRRKAERKPNSIWGDLDLKSVARQAYEARFFLPGQGDASQVGQPEGQDSSPELTLTPAMAQRHYESATEEIPMPDENEIVTETNRPDPIVAPPAPVKQRKPRTTKAAAQADPSQVSGAVSDSIDATAGKPRRGRKATTIPAANLAKSTPLNRARKTTDVAPAAPVAVDAIDDMTELLRLEEENRNLRKQLSEKLRSENADLRKRLNLA